MNVPALRFPEFEGEWEQLKLGDLGPVSMCKRVFKDETHSVGDVPFFKIGTFGKEPDAFISREKFEDFKEKFSFPKVGEILISAAGTIGRTVIYDGADAYFQDSNIVWIANDEAKVVNSYLAICYDIIQWTTENTTIARLYNANLKSKKITAPSLPEQKKIAAFLGAVDAKIAALRARRDGLERYKRGLMQALFSQTLSFTKPDGSAFPDWEEKRLGELLRLLTDAIMPNQSDEYFEYYSLPAFDEFGTSIRVHGSEIDSNKFQIGENMLLVSKLNPRKPRVMKTTRSELRSCCSTEFMVYVVREASGPISDYYFHLFNSDSFVKRLKSSATGSTNSHVRVTPSETLRWKMYFPHPDEQAKIAEALSAMDAKIAAVGDQVAQMEAFKKGLLQQMFV